MVLHNFYNRLLQATRTLVDVAADGVILNETYQEAYNLIEEMSLNNYQWSKEQATLVLKNILGKLEVVSLTLFSAKVNVMSNRLEKLNVNLIAASSSSNPTCEICGVIDHIGLDCKVDSPFAQDIASEKVHALGSFSPRP